jgi:hypothetical protein
MNENISCQMKPSNNESKHHEIVERKRETTNENSIRQTIPSNYERKHSIKVSVVKRNLLTMNEKVISQMMFSNHHSINPNDKWD